MDVYAGGYVSLSLGHQIKFQYITREYATGYESKNTGNWRIPFSFAVGAGALLGADYYFRKNIAIGVSGLVGFSSSFQYGNQIEQVISTNTGSLNPRQGTTSSEQKRTLKNAYTSTGLSGGAGLNFIFFLMLVRKDIPRRYIA